MDPDEALPCRPAAAEALEQSQEGPSSSALSSQRQHSQQPIKEQVICPGSAGSVPASACWLSRLELMAVQPACLKAHPDTPLPQQQQGHQQQGQQQPQQHGNQQEPAAGAQQSVQHELLLHLKANFTTQPAQRTGQPEAAADAHTPGAPAGFQPLPLPAAELQLLVLSRQMQAVQQQSIRLLQLVLQQQQQVQEGVVQPGCFSPACTSRNSNSRCDSSRSSSTSSSSWQTSSSSAPVGATSSSSSFSSSSVNPSYSWAVCLNLHVSIPSHPTAQPLDLLHLVLRVQPAQQLLAEAAAAGAGLMAEVPLLVMPSAAQQEVQQLLLPAMRQEVQAEQQQQQRHGVSASVDDFASQCMQVEHAAWQHFCQLSHDIYAVMHLAAAAEAAATAPSAAADDEAADEAAEAQVGAAAAGAAAAVEVVLANPLDAAATGGESAAAPPAAALAHVADSLLFPLLLPFLAAHGMHNTLRLLLGCLPQQLQQQWWQQQEDRVQELEAAAPPTLHVPGEELESMVGTGPAAAAVAAAGKAKQQQLGKAENVPCKDSNQGAGAGGAGCLDGPGSTCRVGKDSSSSSSSKGQAAKRQQASSKAGENGITAAAAAAAAASVPWYLPLTQFDGDMEHRYLDWKHHALVHLDYMTALFDLLYLLVLLKRMMSEPSTLYYFCYIIIKTLPHVPLMMGLRGAFHRHRETWLFLVAPACALLTWCMAVYSVVQGRPPMLLTNRAARAYWNSRGELPTSIMRPFMQHMRLRPYAVYALLDAAVSAWVFGQDFGVLSAARRWCFAATLSIGLCWGLELHMRRRFVRRQHV